MMYICSYYGGSNTSRLLCLHATLDKFNFNMANPNTVSAPPSLSSVEKAVAKALGGIAWSRDYIHGNGAYRGEQ